MDPSNQNPDNEINLFELAETTWEGKWLVALVIFVTTMCGLIYFVIFPPAYKGELFFTQVDTEVASEFAPVNNLPDLPDITATSLLNDFVTQFEDYEEARAAIRAHSTDFLHFKGSEKEKAQLETKLALQYELITPSKNQEKYTIAFKAANAQQGIIVLDNIMRAVALSVAKQNLQMIQNIKESIALSIADELEKLQKQAEIKRSIYLYDRKKRMLFLQEQADIARELGIADNTFETTAAADKKEAVNVNVRTETPFYLRGYKAIEKEINLLASRKQEDAIFYINGYKELLEKIESIKADTRIQNIDRAIALVPLNAALRPVAYQIDLVVDKSGNKMALAFIMLVFMGGLIGILWVNIKKGYQGYRRQQLAQKTSV